ncbi:arsenate reductase [Patellaria atrata CBS 101060]|uniref:Arsenate reductase n=1 Tax=Patellaria atrata CBS 101060 TaxID=1346257 RepID=A0A9P4VQD1_9PEZI|nr:arsenate reductase [Patellaria atrata CBS 101060]
MTSPSAWYDAYPKPRHESPSQISREELLERIRNGQKAGIDFILIDLRRNDHEGPTIKGSINLPAQTLYSSLSTLLNLCTKAKIDTVIWYCGSSRGRGSRAAVWFADLVEDSGVDGISSLALTGGITGWVQAGEEYGDLMDGKV